MRHFDLCLIGSGSANTIADERFGDWSIALVEKGRFGGTCLNVGCIPSKMFVYPADLAAGPARAHRLGVDLRLDRVRWRDLRDRIFGRIDSISTDGERWRAEAENVTLIREAARFVGPRRLALASGEQITADRMVVAAGSRPVVPELPGLAEVAFHTSDTVMRIEELPGSVAILGGGYVAAEFAHVFAAFGVRVTIVHRGGSLLRREDADVSHAFTQVLGRRVDLRLNTRVQRVEALGAGVRLHTRGADRVADQVDADLLLVATGRTPNGDTLDLAAGEIQTDQDGFIRVDEFQRTTADGVFALGDVSSHAQLKHVANHEARVVAHNLQQPEAMVASDHRYIPHAVFSDPQVASVGLTEAQAAERAVPHVTALEHYSSTAYGWAMEDTEHFVKLVADPRTGLLLGAHLIGPQASSLIQPLIQAMQFGLPAHRMARGQYWIHPAMAEVVENALLALPLC